MRLLHHSFREVHVAESREQVPVSVFYDKPKGLWVSVEGADDWAHWCRLESPGYLGKLTYEVKLAEDARIYCT